MRGIEGAADRGLRGVWGVLERVVEGAYVLQGHPGKVVGGSGRRSMDITRGDSQTGVANILCAAARFSWSRVSARAISIRIFAK